MLLVEGAVPQRQGKGEKEVERGDHGEGVEKQVQIRACTLAVSDECGLDGTISDPTYNMKMTENRYVIIMSETYTKPARRRST